jgi:deaminated glutathione amidase
MPLSSSTPPLRVAAVQISSGPDPYANLTNIRSGVRQAAERGARLVVLPEAAMASFGTDLRAIAEPGDGRWAGELRALAAALDIVVVAGMFEPAEDGRVYNTLLVTGAAVETAYRKVHLFDAFGSWESDVVAAGTDFVIFEMQGITVGLATCFDLRFSDQFIALGRAGAHLLVVPASWRSGPGKEEQWNLLTRARAADAQAWLLACDQAWVPPRGADPLGVGLSLLVDPLGQVRAQLGTGSSVLVADIDVATVEATRESVPVLKASRVAGPTSIQRPGADGPDGPGPDGNQDPDAARTAPKKRMWEKPELDFTHPGAAWLPSPGATGGIWDLLLSQEPTTGDTTLMQRYDPGAATHEAVITHDYWEEVLVISGELTDRTSGDTATTGMYACRPPGMRHGPYVSESGCLMLVMTRST